MTLFGNKLRAAVRKVLDEDDPKCPRSPCKRQRRAHRGTGEVSVSLRTWPHSETATDTVTHEVTMRSHGGEDPNPRDLVSLQKGQCGHRRPPPPGENALRRLGQTRIRRDIREGGKTTAGGAGGLGQRPWRPRREPALLAKARP